MGKGMSVIATAGLAIGLLSGCGREAIQAPAPQPLVLELTPIGDATERGEVRLFDLGRDAEVQLAGTGFSQTGAYYATYGREVFVPFWPVGVYPAPISVRPGGEASYLGVFSIQTLARPGDRLYVLYDADGEPGERYEGAVPVLSAPLPDSLFP